MIECNWRRYVIECNSVLLEFAYSQKECRFITSVSPFSMLEVGD